MEHEQTLRDIIREYSAWTSTHGIPHIVLTENTFLRSIWAVLTLSAFGAAIYQVVTLFIRYFSYSVIIEPTTEFMALAFPTVTFCNSNPWKRQAADGTPLQDLINAYDSEASGTKFGLDSTDLYSRQLQAQEWMLLMGENILNQVYDNTTNLAYNWNDLFISCNYNDKNCGSSSFVDYYDVYHGHCFQFNANGILNSSRAGPSRGLRVLMRIHQSDNLPWTMSTGATIAISTFGRSPFPDTFGYSIPIGEATSFGLDYLRRKKLDYPFSNCTFTSDNLKQPIYYNSIYTVETCIRSCLQDKIIQACGCYMPKFNVAFNRTVPSCYNVEDPNMAIICANQIQNFVRSSDWNVYDNCECPFACDQTTYIVTTSSRRWPAKTYVPPECVSLEDGRLTGQTFGTEAECVEYYKANTLSVEVYFNTITMQIQEEEQGYKIINFIADAGGATGLWLGMSVVSIIEAFLFLCVVIRFILFRPKAVRIDPSYDYFATFKNLENFGSHELYREDSEIILPPPIQDPV